MNQLTLRQILLATCAGALLATSGASFAGVAEAEVAYVKQEYFQAYREVIEPAKKGEAAAQSVVGRIYFEGNGAPRDHFAAFSWYRKAAEQGHASAQYELACFYQNGNGTKPDPALAAQWMEKAAGQGVLWAMVGAGNIFRDGQGVPADPVKAFQWFSIAAAATETPATAETIKLAKQAVAELQPKLEPAQLQAAQKQATMWQAARIARDTTWMQPINKPLPTVIRKPVEPDKNEMLKPGASPLAKDFFPKS